MMNFIRKTRKSLGLTGAELSKEVGVLPSSISNYECGYRIPNRDTALKLRDYFISEGVHCSLDDFYTLKS